MDEKNDKMEPPTNPPELVEKILKERVFITAIGGSLMRQTDEGGVPLVLKPNQEHRRLWFETLPTPPDPLPEVGCYPYRNGGFGVMCDLNVGTIDELVELYRERLTQACRTMVSSPVMGNYLDPTWRQRVNEVYGPTQPGRGTAVPMLDEIHPKVMEIREIQALLAKRLLEHAARESREATAIGQAAAGETVTDMEA